MDQLSNVNDISVSVLGISPLLLAAVVVTLLLHYKHTLSLSMFEVSNRTYALLVSLAVLVLASLSPFLHFSVHPPGGTDFYFARALNIVRFGVFGVGHTPGALFPPGYSFLLLPATVLLGDSQWAFIITNLLLLVGISLVIRSLLQGLGLTQGQANLVSLVIIIYPNRLLSILLPLSDIPFSMVYLCSFLLMMLSVRHPERRHLPIGAGLVAGFAALVRATGLPLLLPLAVGLWWPRSAPSGAEGAELIRRLRARNLALLAASAVLVLLPWSIRNVALFGKVIPVSNNFGVNLAIGNNPAAGVTHSSNINSPTQDLTEWWREGGDTAWNEAQIDSFLFRKGLKYIQDRPMSFMVRGLGKIFHTLASDASTFGMHQTYDNLSTLVYSIAEWLHLGPSATAFAYAVYATAYRFLFVVNNAFYYTVFALMLILLFRQRRRWNGPEVAYLLVILITCGLAFVLFGNSRFKEPIPALTLILFVLQMKKPDDQAGSLPITEDGRPGVSSSHLKKD